jgi:FkbM family methyltransferase
MWMSGLKKRVRALARRFGFDIVRYDAISHPLARRKQILDSSNINLVLDVGANTGQYALQMREIGYKGRIVSFEPMTSAFEKLRAVANEDALWDVMNCALGDQEGTAEINIAGNSYSSSLLNMLPAHVKSEPTSEYVGKETITVTTLDAVFPTLAKPSDNVYLKIDTQGFEEHVLKGAEAALGTINTIQLEMSLTPLYEDELLFNEMYRLLYEKGYRLLAVEPGFTDTRTGQLLQLDGVFQRA